MQMFRKQYFKQYVASDKESIELSNKDIELLNHEASEYASQQVESDLQSPTIDRVQTPKFNKVNVVGKNKTAYKPNKHRRLSTGTDSSIVTPTVVLEPDSGIIKFQDGLNINMFG